MGCSVVGKILVVTTALIRNLFVGCPSWLCFANPRKFNVRIGKKRISSDSERPERQEAP